jgi:hypothetical protein
MATRETQSVAWLRRMTQLEHEIAALLGIDAEYVEVDVGGTLFHMDADELLRVLRTKLAPNAGGQET